jgi:hypothetical protein
MDSVVARRATLGLINLTPTLSLGKRGSKNLATLGRIGCRRVLARDVDRYSPHIAEHALRG